MKRILMTAAAAVILAGPGLASAQPYDHDHYDHDRGRYDHDRYDHDRGDRGGWRDDWREGHRMDRDYWRHAHRVDWRRHHLRRPPRGYEWREVDGRYVLAAAATGLIASIIMNSDNH